ncbi:MAG: type VI secretion system protein [Paracraurococcus sp.]
MPADWSRLEPLRPFLPVLAILLAAVFLALCVLAARLLRQQRRGAALRTARRRLLATEPGEGLALFGADVARVAGGAGPYLAPWIGLVGASGPAFDALLPPRTGLPAGFEPTHRMLLERHARLGFCRGGLVLGFEDGLLDSARWEERWRATLAAARRCRGDRALDGLVVAIRAAELSGADRDALAARGEQIYVLLRETQRLTGWRLPVTFVLEGCEALDGFAALAAAVPAMAEARPLGWAVPYALDTAFESRWIREGVESLVERLTLFQLQAGAAIANTGEAAQLGAFIHAVASLADPLTILLTAALRSSAYHEAFMVRGLFLAGGAATGQEARPAAFGPALFETKVFPEHRLPQPAIGEATRRHSQIRWLQALLVAIGLLCAAGAVSLERLRDQEIRTLQILLDDIDQTTGMMRRGTAEDGSSTAEQLRRARALLGTMGHVTVNSLATVAAPTSFLSGTDAQVTSAIGRGWEASILGIVGQSLASRRLYQQPTVSSPRPEDEQQALAGFAQRVVDHAAMIRRFQHLGEKRDIADLEEVLDYALRISLPPSFRNHYELYLDALPGSTSRLIGVTERLASRPDLPSAQEQLRVDFDAQLGAAYQRGPLSRTVEELVDTVHRLRVQGDPAASRQQLADLSRLLEMVSSQLDAGGWKWAIAPQPPSAASLPQPVLDALATIEARIPDGGLIDAPLVSELRARAVAHLQVARNTLLGARLPDGRPILERSDKSLRLAPALTQVREPLAQLLALPLMEPVPVGVPMPVTRPEAGIDWDLAVLERARRLADGLQTRLPATLRPLPPILRPAIESVAAHQLSGHVEALLRQAARPEGAGPGPEIAGFAAAAPTLALLRDSLRQARQPQQAAQLNQAVTVQALRLLRWVENRLAAAAPYQLPDPTLSAWTGTGPLAPVAFQVASVPELAAALAARREFIDGLARGQAQPLLLWLRDPGTGAPAAEAPLIARWQGILEALDRQARGDASGALGQLEAYILVELDRASTEGCQGFRPLPPAGGSNYFAAQQAAIQRAVAARCRTAERNSATEAYARLAADFQAELAGRFPFVARVPPVTGPLAGGTGRGQADPAEVRRFFQLHGRGLPALRDQLAAMPGQTAAEQFVSRLTRVQEVLAPLLTDPSPDAVLAYDIAPAFYTNAAASRGMEGVLEIAVATGDRRLSSREPAGSLTWIAGQPVELALRWAANGPNLPAAAQAREPATLRLRHQGPWALLELLRARAPGTAELATLPDRQPEVLAITVPLRPNPAAAIGGQEASSARLYIRLALTGTVRAPGQPDRRVPIALPAFPWAAPALQSPPLERAASLVRPTPPRPAAVPRRASAPAKRAGEARR